ADGAPWTLSLRLPGWCQGPRLRLNGRALDPRPDQHGYARIAHAWRPGDELELELSMPPRLVEPHPRLDAARGCLALERGPLVYCLEQPDHADADVLDLALDPAAPLESAWRPGLLGGVVTIQASGAVADVAPWQGRL